MGTTPQVVNVREGEGALMKRLVSPSISGLVATTAT
jgi:hypothetical protein